MVLSPQALRSCEEKETDPIPCIYSEERKSEERKRSSETCKAYFIMRLKKLTCKFFIPCAGTLLEEAEQNVASEKRDVEEIKRDLDGVKRKVEVLGKYSSLFLCETKEKEEGREMALPLQMDRSCEEKETYSIISSERWKRSSDTCKVLIEKRKKSMWNIFIRRALRKKLLEKAEQNVPSKERDVEEIKRDLEGIKRKVEDLGRYRSPFLCETKKREEGREMALPLQMHRSCEEKETDLIPCKSQHVTVGAARDLLEKAAQSMPLEELKRKVEGLKLQVEVRERKLEKFVVFRSFEPPTGHQPPQSGSSHDPGFTDMVLMIASEDGPNGRPSMPVLVHRDILVSRSPVFKAMLENEMEESRSGTIKVSDMSNDALQVFVIFLHAEACVNEQMACELLVSAEKYQVEHLKAYFEKFLASKLNWDNSIEYYAFAHQHNAKHLVEAATSLISDNLDKLRKRQEYSLLVEEDPRLGLELLEACLVRRENNAALDTSAK